MHEGIKHLMKKLRSSVFEKDLFDWIPLNLFLFFTPRFIRSRIVRRFLSQLSLMAKNQIPFGEGMRTIASPRRVRMPVHYTVTRTLQWLLFIMIELNIFSYLKSATMYKTSAAGGLFLVIGIPLLLLGLFLLRPGFVLWAYLAVIVLSIMLISLFGFVGALVLLFFLLFLLFFLRMNIQSVKINDSYLVRRVARRLTTKLANGTSLATAMGSLPRLFLPFHTTMMKTAEATGKMREILHQLAEYERWRGRFYVIGLKNFAYPAILFFIALTLISFVTIIIYPKFEGIFAQMGASMPEFTRSVVNSLISIPARGGFGLLFLVVMAIVIFGAWGSLKYYVPVIRQVARPLSASRFLMALGHQLKARLPINEAVRVARHVDSGLVFSHYMQDLQTRIEKGVPLAAALEQVAIFPPMTKHWVSMVEFAEALDTELLDIAKKLAEDGEARFTKLTTTLEPIVHLIIAFVIGIVVISFYLPIFNIPTVILAGGG